MTPALAHIVADGHLHVYPGFRPDLACDCLLANLDRHARAAWPGDPRDTERLAFLAEGAAGRWFQDLRAGAADPAGLEILADHGVCLDLLHRGARRLRLVAGRQVVTRERLEVLGLAGGADVPDGLPVRETLARVATAGGVPVLAWSPGKWWGPRGRLVRQLLDEYPPGELALGDSSLRARGWPEPEAMRLARQRGCAILPGSDPLPLPGEERQLGVYGVVAEAPFDPQRPAESVRALLTEHRAALAPIGRRNSWPGMLSRLARLRLAKARR